MTVPDEGSTTNVECLSEFLSNRIVYKTTFEDFVEERNELLKILSNTITCGESDSALIVGPRGCGKSFVVNECLTEISKSFDCQDYLIVNLNGFVHTDDSLALRAIIEQLHVDLLDGDQITGSFAGGTNTSSDVVDSDMQFFDTFCNNGLVTEITDDGSTSGDMSVQIIFPASEDGTLSYSVDNNDNNLAAEDISDREPQVSYEEVTQDITEQIQEITSDNLQFVIQSFKRGNRRTSQPIIFILDKFQFFCGHRNQTLLYNLFDMSKNGQTPICVIGVTCRNDITELLEKRVSSRFTHRIIQLTPNISLETRLSEFSQYLKIEKKVPAIRKVDKSYIKQWNDHIDGLLATPKVVQCIRRQLEVDPSRKAFKNLVFHLVTKVTDSNPLITSDSVEDSFRQYFVDAKVESLKYLSVMELCLVISMCHHADIYEGEPFNFEMILEKYLKFAKRNSAVQITERLILMKAFERIKELELITPMASSTRNQKKEHSLYRIVVTKRQVSKTISSYSNLPTDVVQWAISSVA